MKTKRLNTAKLSAALQTLSDSIDVKSDAERIKELEAALNDAADMFDTYADLHAKGKLTRPEWSTKMRERAELARYAVTKGS